MSKPAIPAAEGAGNDSHLLQWINAEEEYIRANRDKIRDGDLDESTDAPPVRPNQETHNRSIARGSRSRARTVPGNSEQQRGAPVQAKPSHSSCCQKAAHAASQACRCLEADYSPAGTAEEDRASILDGLDEQERYAHSSDHKLVGSSLDDEKTANDCIPVDQLDRTKIRRLLKNKNLDLDDRVAIQWFLGQFKRSKWMHWQDIYPERIAVTVLSSWHRGKDVAYCGYGGRHCKEPDFCPKCAIIERADAAVTEHEGLFDRLLLDGQRRYFYAISLSYDWNPARAGLHYVIEKRNSEKGTPDKLLHDYPFKGQPAVAPFTIDNDIGKENNITACFRAIFGLAKFLSKINKQWGVLAHRHIAWHFFEYHGLPHHIRPNGHLLVVADEPITFEVGQLLLKRFQWAYENQQFGDVLYCDVHISPLVSQTDIERWIYYMFKPMDYARPYRDAVQRGANIEALNHEVDNCVFQGGNSVLSVPSPMRFGVLHVNTGPDRYLGTKNVTLQREQAKNARKAKRQSQSRESGDYHEPERYIERITKYEQFLRDEGSF